jgi:(1->4)-alpha-D-glucan 1-alpha-D-glucosylmutase
VTTVLERLAAVHGIAPGFHDIWGHWHRVSDASLRALLAAMGVDAVDDRRVQDALDDTQRKRWRRSLAPMIVVRAHRRPWIVSVCLPAATADSAAACRIVTEAGEELGGELTPLAHPVERATIDGQACMARDYALPLELPPGYHRLEVRAGDVVAAGCLAVAPAACYRPPALAEGRRSFGFAAQLYGLRSERNWGIGDFTDLADLVALAGARGAGIVGINPLHALYPDNPDHDSPYSPSSRLFVNALYLDVEAIPGFGECEQALHHVRSVAFQARLAALRDAPLVDYAGVAAAKREVLELLYADFQHGRAPDDDRASAFRAFRAQGGDALERHATFEALQERFTRNDPSIWGWPAWPQAFRDPASPDVARFAQAHAERVEFFAWLQWQADLQRRAVADRARTSGLDVGVYADLAVSIDRGGAESWGNQDRYATGASVGAPPDAFSPRGQDWGLPPLVPGRLGDAAYAPFLATLRANMRHAGALRIDHVMGLMRLFWVPAGATPSEGAYVHYPFDDLLGLLALESHRHHCLVIGEDLGTVPDEVRRALADNDILSYRVLLFEREHGGAFRPPASYPAPALVTASTHDLPTLAGWWEGHDIVLRAEHGLIASEVDRDVQLAERARDRQCLLDALAQAGVLPAEVAPDAQAQPRMTDELADAVQTFIAQTPSILALVQLEDTCGVREQANLPGTVEGHPNWRRKLPLTLGALAADARFRALVERLRATRGANT